MVIVVSVSILGAGLLPPDAPGLAEGPGCPVSFRAPVGTPDSEVNPWDTVPISVEDSFEGAEVDSDTPSVVVVFLKTMTVAVVKMMESSEASELKLDDEFAEEGDPGVTLVAEVIVEDEADSGAEAWLEVLFSAGAVEFAGVGVAVAFQSLHIMLLPEVGPGENAGPVLWQGAPYSQHA